MKKLFSLFSKKSAGSCDDLQTNYEPERPRLLTLIIVSCVLAGLITPTSAQTSFSTYAVNISDLTGGDAPYSIDNIRDALQINAAVEAYRDVWAAATLTPGLIGGFYDVKLTSMREFDGESPYQLLVNGRVVGTRVNGATDESNDYALEDHYFLNVSIPAGATVTVRSQAVTNGLIPEGDGTAYSRGRWTAIDIQPAGTFDSPAAISGDQMQWHKVTLTIDGPTASETDTAPNPFYDYRMQVTFSNGTTQISVPGYFAADGAAAETSATSGSKWRAHFMPTLPGIWTYEVDFRSGSAVAITNSPSNFPEVSPYDGVTGSFPVTVSDKSGDDFRSPDKGRLRYSGKAFPEWMGSGSAFVKAAVNSPELLLEYEDFDNTNSTRSYSTHFSDWTETDPTWQGSEGKEIIGLVNYISSIGINSHYFLTMNTAGDGGNAYPWTGSTSFFSYDTSKTDQWQILFDHMMTKGVQVQFVLSEQENQSLFENPANGGSNELFAPSRRLYYREMVARYGYLNAIIWNIGEENGWDRGDLNNGNDVVNDYEQRISYAAYVESLLAYPDNISIHNGPATDDYIFGEFIDNGIGSYRGISFQGRYEDPFYGHDRIVFWRNSSEAAGTPWIVAYDEPFINSELNSNSEKNNMRENSVWAAFTGGAAGVGIYNGGGFDLTVQDYRLYEDFFEIAVRGKDFFASSFDDITSAVPSDSLVTGNNNWCLAHVDNTYVVYLRDGGTTTLDLTNATGTFDVKWFDPDGNNTNLQDGSVTSVTGGGIVQLGDAPSAVNSDWAILVKKANADLTPTILTSSLSSVQAGGYFSSIISVKSGDLPNTFSVSGGALPSGLSLNSATGDLTGTPTLAGEYSFTVLVTDVDGDTDTQAFTLTVNESGNGGQVTVFEEANGLLIIEAENANIDTTWWSEETRVSGFLGDSYIVMDGPSNQFATPGNGIIDYVIEITNAGEYQFQWRSFITDKDGGPFNDNKEHNDNWLRILDSNGTPITPLPVPDFDFNNRNNQQNDDIPDTAGDGWYKVYRNGDVTEWDWQASNQDNDALALIWSFQANETYTIQISARSQGHAIDRLMFWDRSGTERADKVRGRMSNNQNNTADGLPLSAFTIQEPINDPQIITSVLPDGNEGESYSQTLVAINGETPYTWAVTAGALPAGLSLNASTGEISGTFTSSGLSTFTVTVTDTDGRTGSRSFSINVNTVFVPPPYVDGVYIESSNRVVMEAELANFDPTWWTADTRVPDFLGGAYLVMDGPQDNFQTPGIAILDFPFTITNAGNYQFQWRSFITDKNGSPNPSNTDHNDNWVRLVDSAGNPILPVAPVPNFDFENRNNQDNDATPDEQSDGWHKVYRNGDTSEWTWQASNQDFDALALFWNLEAGETYSLQISARSVGHAIDRVTLWNRDTQNRADKVKGTTRSNQDNRFDSRALSEFVPTVQQPFNAGNVPWSLPTRIEAEDFDIGGQGTSYLDSDVGNRGDSSYRSGEDVDVGTAIDGGDAIKVNWTADGEWLEYTVNPSATQYELSVRVASANANPGSLRLTLDGVLLTEIDVASTGDWSQWETLTSSPFSLNSGEQVLRVEIVGGNFDINWFDFVEFAPVQGTFGNNGNPWSLPGSIEAENFDTGGQGVAYLDSDAGNRGNSSYRDGEDVDLGTTVDNGDAIKLNWTVDGEWVEYTVNPAADQYELQVRVASGSTDPGSLRLTLDGTLLTEIDVTPTGGWSNWETLTSTPFLLGSGEQVLRVEIVGGNFDINRFDFIEFVPPQETFGNNGNPWALPGLIEVENFDTGGEAVAYFDTSVGNNGDSDYRSDTNVDVRTSLTSASGLAVGWNADTEWLEYTIDPQAGLYDLTVTAASANNSPGQVRFLIDGQTLATINISTTGDWDTFQSYTATGIPLTSGQQVLRLEIVGGAFDLDSFVFEFQQNFMSAQRSQFGMASDGSDDTADDSGNGVENILYLLFNMGDPSGLMTQPLTVSQGAFTPGLPTIWKNESNGQINYSFLWPLNSGDYVADLQVSYDLVTWTSLAELPVAQRPTLETQAFDSNYLIYNYMLPSSSQEVFIRLNITTGSSL